MMKAIAETTEFKRIDVVVHHTAGAIDALASRCRLIGD
jgi:hypothetical protein